MVLSEMQELNAHLKTLVPARCNLGFLIIPRGSKFLDVHMQNCDSARAGFPYSGAGVGRTC